MAGEPKDKWDKFGIILQPVGGLLTAIAIVLIGHFASKSLETAKTNETRAQLYAELMSKREEAESALRKDMFKSIIETFLQPGAANTDERVLNLELLAYNFHESLNLKPLFVHLYRQISKSSNSGREELLERLDKVAREITGKQMLVLTQVGASSDRVVEPGMKDKDLDAISMTVDGVKRDFIIHINEVDIKNKTLRMEVEIFTYKGPDEREEERTKPFSVGYFDFPMIDNTRLSNGQRFAIVLNESDSLAAHITLVCFPGSYASLKDKPYYDEVIDNLKMTKGSKPF